MDMRESAQILAFAVDAGLDRPKELSSANSTDRWVADIDCVVQSLPVGSLTPLTNSLPRKCLIIPGLTPLRPALQPPSD